MTTEFPWTISDEKSIHYHKGSLQGKNSDREYEYQGVLFKNEFGILDSIDIFGWEF